MVATLIHTSKKIVDSKLKDFGLNDKEWEWE